MAPAQPGRSLPSLVLLSLVGCVSLAAQVNRVDPDKSITIDVTGATAAYSLDPFVAEANAENGIVTVEGKHPGTTYVVAVGPSATRNLEVLVTTPPPRYPPGFVMPVAVTEVSQSGYYEGRYYSSPAQFQNQFDFLKGDGHDWTHVHLVETTLVGPLEQEQGRVALSSASYQIVTPRRDMTLFDKYVDESPLTINGSIVRGFHLRQDTGENNWFVHAGYTSIATFEGLFLPTQPELVLGGGYRYALNANSSLTGSFYQIHVAPSDQAGRSGSIGAIRYEYRPRESFWFNAEVGLSHGVGAAARLHYKTQRNSIVALVRYMPPLFSSLGANNFRGLHSDISWTSEISKKLEMSLTFYNNNLVMPGFSETTVSGGANFHYRFAPRWSIVGGAIASTFQSKLPPAPAIRNFSVPAGLAFQVKHFGADAQYQFAVSPGRDTGGNQFRVNVHSGWRAFALAAYAERDTNAPTLNLIFGQLTGLQQILEQLGLAATTVKQMDDLLSSNAALIASGYLRGATINLVPLRSQIGGSVEWTGAGVHTRLWQYSFLFNDNHLLGGSTQNVVHTVSYSQRLTHSDDLALSCSATGVKSPGVPLAYAPVCFIALRHQFRKVPAFIVPERHGTISGVVFRDDQSRGVHEAGMPPMPEVEVVLDEGRRMLTRGDGSYSFTGVPRGPHKIAIAFRSRRPFFFTTSSERDVNEDATADFGIGYSLSGLVGRVVSDAGLGIPAVAIVIRSGIVRWNTVTESDGSFFVSALSPGPYSVQADADSLPPGYSPESLSEPRQVMVAPSAPGRADFSVRAFRSITGRVLTYSPAAGLYVPVAGVEVILRESGSTTTTDGSGRYLFQDLAAGTYTISLPGGAPDSAKTVILGAPPSALINVDFQVVRPVPPLAGNAGTGVNPRASPRQSRSNSIR